MFGILKDLFSRKEVISIPINNNKLNISDSSLYLDVFYVNGTSFTYKIIDSARSDDELVKLYSQKIADDYPFISFTAGGTTVFIFKERVCQFIIRKGDL